MSSSMTTSAEAHTMAPHLADAFDLIVKGGRVVDPAQGIDRVLDVGIRGGFIAALGPQLKAGADTRVVDAAGAIVTPGLIDTHAHVFEHVTGQFGLNADLVGVRSGVTTLVDQGGPSVITFNGFRKFVVEPARSRVYTYMSAYLAVALLGHDYIDLYGPSGIDVKALVKVMRDNLDLVRGIKVHAEPGAYSRWGMAPLALAKEASRELNLPVYVHLGTLWPELEGRQVDPMTIIDEILPLLDPGDILAHPFTFFPSGFVSPEGEIHPMVQEALRRGVRIDVGRGNHFSVDTARRVLDAGIVPFTLGADLHGFNVPRVAADGSRSDEQEAGSPFARPYSLQHVMTEMLALGVPLMEVVRMTTSNAAIMLGLERQMGSLVIGMPADISVMRLLHDKWTLVDAKGVEFESSQLLHPECAVRAGTVYQADSPLLPPLLSRRLAA